MINNLPTELVLKVLSHSPIKTLHSLCLVCHQLNDIIQAHEASIYHNAATFHGYVPANAHYNEIYSSRSLVGIDGWKSFCKRRVLIAQGWLGRQPSTLRQHSRTASNSKVHRFKIDERRGFIVSTSSQGSLNVTDLATGDTLWALDKELNYVRRFAQCDYGEGFVVFDRDDASKEVWRLASEYNMSPLPAISLPDSRQLDAYARSCALYPASRVQFRPWLLLHIPLDTRAYRFVYPSLLVSGLHQAIIFDVPTGARVQRIDELQDAPHLRPYRFDNIAVHDVDLGAQHVLVCCAPSLKVFSRATGDCILQIGSHEILYSQHRFRLIPEDAQAVPHTHPHSELVECRTQQEIYTSLPRGRQFDQFVAVRVSPCGLHVALLLSCSRLIVVPYFERIIAGEAWEEDTLIDIELGCIRYESIDLAYEHDRIAVATAGGVFVVHLHLDERWPYVTVNRVARMTDPDDLQYVSCMQMTDTGLFVNCKPSPDPEHASRTFNTNLSDKFASNVQALRDRDRLVVAPPHEAIAAVSAIYDLNVVPV
ncbi:hypothetical protein PC9H_004358 [Pleurotus ostreatus]|uniref:F-box domain-containing protein n=1 Tax=Pleurotus ostreatus TaxID=5322 RepID=A0A8H7A411_PLEOS|nr:uncharacterized protein PC9H_004358 [Pleurotus ostreatus]KAF7437516.1 hypothetical protein PC9H_004358 [Pleurotus ostreatus]